MAPRRISQIAFTLMVSIGLSSANAQSGRKVPPKDKPLVIQMAKKSSNGVVVSSKDFPDRKTAAWSVSKTSLRDGVEQGIELVDIDNGTLKLQVIPTRGMSIMKASCGDVSLGWDSPVKKIVHPKHIDLNDHGGLGWLAGFNEMMVRCGVSFAGHPGEDDGKMLTLHGRIGNIPASNVTIVVDHEAPYRIRIRGLVEEKMFKFGVFELWTEISTVPGSHEFEIQDTLVNRSEYAKEYQMIYHSNFGRPLLEKDARFRAPIRKVSPFDEGAAKNLDRFETFLGPTKGFGEQVYCLELYANEKGNTQVMLENADGNRGVAIHYPVKALPHFTLWKNTDTLTDGYVTGLEPGTGYPYNRSVERKEGRVPKLSPQSKIQFKVGFTVLRNKQEIAASRKAIEAIQAGRKTEVSKAPPKTE